MKRKWILTAVVLLLAVSVVIWCSACTNFAKLYRITQPDLGKTAAISVDGNAARKPKVSGTGAHTITFRWDSPVEMNTVMLYESSNNRINDFKIYLNGESDFVYQQDEIGKARCAYLGTRQVTELTVSIEKSDGKYSVSDVKILNMPRKRTDFRIFSYMVLGENGASFQQYDLESVKHVTDVILFGDTELSFDQHGKLNINRTVISQAIAKLRSANPDVKIHAALLPRSDGDPAVDNLEWPHNIVAIHKGAFQSADFMNAVVSMCNDYGFDGVGFDYEYPQTKGDYKQYSDFLKDLRAALPTQKQVTCAVNQWTTGMDWNYIDNILVMSYDFIGRYNAHSNWADGVCLTLESVKNSGMPQEKVMLGLPFYSRPNMVKSKWNLVSYWGDYKTDYEKLGRFTNMIKINEKREILWEDEPMLIDSLYYNSYQMICDKTAMCYDYGTGGVMIWNYGADLPYSNPMSLHRAINEAIA